MQTEIQKIILKEEFLDILGQKDAKNQIKSALLSNRNIIIAGPPGIGKTTLAKNIAKVLSEKEVNDCDFHCLPKKPFCPKCKTGTPKQKKVKGKDLFVRIQGSPDLTAEDLIGDIDPIKALKFGPFSVEAFTPGKIFKANNGILFFDEVNRCPEKLQNALLQVLQEKKATIGGYDVDFDADFVFIGTMNPEDQNTEALSDVFLDRVDIIHMDYPDKQSIEEEIVGKYGKQIAPVPNFLFSGMIEFVRILREDESLEKVPSVRASIGLYERAQANALLDNNKSVTFKNFHDAVFSVLSHRIKLKPSKKYLQGPKEYIEEKFKAFSENAGLAKEGEVP
ncbi:AAA domain-containing protein [Candidatus Woesearchaeota archaeon]|nr:AAA domain-containing protein [Candidatus Woesearchaeota archaeon]